MNPIPTEDERAEMAAKLAAWSCECKPSDVGLCEYCHLTVDLEAMAPGLFEAIDVAVHALKQVPTNLHTYRCAIKQPGDDNCTCHCKTVKAALVRLRQGDPK